MRRGGGADGRAALRAAHRRHRRAAAGGRARERQRAVDDAISHDRFSAQAPTLWGPAGARIGWPLLSRIQGTAPALPADPDPSAACSAASAPTIKRTSARTRATPPSWPTLMMHLRDRRRCRGRRTQPTGAAIAANLERLSDKSAAAFSVGVNGHASRSRRCKRRRRRKSTSYGASGPIDFDAATGDMSRRRSRSGDRDGRERQPHLRHRTASSPLEPV